MLTSEQLQGLGEAELRTLAQDLLARLSHSDNDLDEGSQARLERGAYLVALLEKLPLAQTVDDYEAPLPWNIALSAL